MNLRSDSSCDRGTVIDRNDLLDLMCQDGTDDQVYSQDSQEYANIQIPFKMQIHAHGRICDKERIDGVGSQLYQGDDDTCPLA